jgi:hypothetical protein
VTCLMHHPPPVSSGPTISGLMGAAELVSNDKIDAALKATDIGWLWVHASRYTLPGMDRTACAGLRIRT